MKRRLLACLFYLRIHHLTRLLFRRRIIILAYHGFTDKRAHSGIENSHGKHLNIALFRSHLEYLQAHYNVISLDQLIEYYAGSRQLPDRPVVITIDDGYESTYVLAYPLLRQYRVPATVFLTTNFVENTEPLWTDRLEYALTVTTASRLELAIGDETLSYDVRTEDSKLACDGDLRSRLKIIRQELRPAILEDLERHLGHRLPAGKEMPEIYRPLEWWQVKEMSASGLVSIGGHTVSHVILTRCTPEHARDELHRSRQLIEERTGSSCRLFCYPNGQVGCFDSSTKQLLKDFGYSCGITTVFGMNDPDSDVFALKRLYVDDRGQMIRFVMTLCGIVGVLDGLKRRIAGLLKRTGRQ